MDEQRVYALYEERFNDREIAKIEKVRIAEISRWREKNNLPNNGRDRKFKPLYDAGAGDEEIAYHYGLETTVSVRVWRKLNNLPAHKNPREFTYYG